MFEQQQELERAQGYRGPATRFFGPLDDVTTAGLAVRDMSIALLVFPGLLLISNWRAGWNAALVVGALAVPALLLLATRSRAAAVLVAIAAVALASWALILNQTFGLWPLLIWVGVLGITQRAFRATFKLHEYSKQQGGSLDGA